MIDLAAGCVGRGEKEKERYLQAKSIDIIVFFHSIYQETQFCGRSPRERVNHVYLVFHVVDAVIFFLCYIVIALSC
jgi:hypothetical protein